MYQSVNTQKTECCLWHIQRYLIERYGVDQSYHDLSPLTWYINTGRASIGFIQKLYEAKPFMIARKLHQGGSYEDVIDRICDYIDYVRV